MTLLPAGSYKTSAIVKLLVWESVWADEFKQNHEAILKGLPVPFQLRYPIPVTVALGKEVTIEYGSRSTLFSVGIDLPRATNSLEVTVTIGKQVYRGITLAYDNFIPAVFDDHTALRPVKKRAK